MNGSFIYGTRVLEGDAWMALARLEDGVLEAFGLGNWNRVCKVGSRSLVCILLSIL